jgi:hypothetical protein
MKQLRKSKGLKRQNSQCRKKVKQDILIKGKTKLLKTQPDRLKRILKR